MNRGTEEGKARELYGKARDQLRELETLPWDKLPADARKLYTRLVRLAVVEAIQGGNAIRRDVLEYWGAAAARATNGKGVEVAICVEPAGLGVIACGPLGDEAQLSVPYADLMTAITPKGAVDEIIAHLLSEIRPAPPDSAGVTFNGGH